VASSAGRGGEGGRAGGGWRACFSFSAGRGGEGVAKLRVVLFFLVWMPGQVRFWRVVVSGSRWHHGGGRACWWWRNFDVCSISVELLSGGISATCPPSHRILRLMGSRSKAALEFFVGVFCVSSPSGASPAARRQAGVRFLRRSGGRRWRTGSRFSFWSRGLLVCFLALFYFAIFVRACL
jgi:hypothetical protein